MSQQEHTIQTNILGLPEPERYHAYVRRAVGSHPYLWITLKGKSDEPQLGVQLDGVCYMDLFPNWKSANICIASRFETIQFMQQVGVHIPPNLKNDALQKVLEETEYYNYYYIETLTPFNQPYRIKILATHHSLERHFPDFLKITDA